MLVRPVSQERPTIRWIEILALAVALTVMFATVVGAANRGLSSVKPGSLPPEIDQWAKPLERVPADATPAPLANEVWRILGLHAEGKYVEAIRAWEALDLPEDSQVWKHVALAQAHLARQQLSQAADDLRNAKAMRTEHPIVHYFLGLLRLEQAHHAMTWLDAAEPTRTRRVAYGPLEGAPNSRSMYELAATIEFEKAIAYAERLEYDEPLMPGHLAAGSALEPTVGDLLVALGAEHFQAKSHHILSHLFLDRGALELAEHHLDSAARNPEGIVLLDEFDRLAEAYRARGRYQDAARVEQKARRHVRSGSESDLGPVLDRVL
jgi:tetratricopeptide (TPR) repeat protein